MKPFTIMEVCGTHTHVIAKAGLKQLLPENVRLISGPGCPVCVTPNAAIDEMIALADIPNVIIATFGDMVRVPGSTTSLQSKTNVVIVYSPMDAVELARNNPDKEIVFLGVGFETTTPTTAVAIKNAPDNFSVYCAHKSMPNVLKLINNVDGLLLPGHVSTIIGIEPYKSLGIPGVVAGFEPEDIMLAIDMLLKCDNEIKIAYTRGVKPEGNPTALNLIEEVFDTCDSEWRGLGAVPYSGYKIKDKYSKYDATKKFDIKPEPTHEHSGCKCGEVLKGVLEPENCPLFAKKCSPANPIGPCMVSHEGSCSAHYQNPKI
ncbi:MAG: hydrogenase formation protein HypD [Coriobacteriia bacterium]|nr:hydrogenase formation protein HypD [Coriobacteriia bacterium]